MKQLVYITLLISFLILTGCGKEDEEIVYDTSYDPMLKEMESTQISSDMCSTIEQAQQQLGYNFHYLTQVPSGYIQDEISVAIQGDTTLAEVDYKKSSYLLTFRASNTTDQLYFRYEARPEKKDVIIADMTISCTCENDVIYTATWNLNGCNYCIICDEGLTLATLTSMISSMQ